MEADDRVDIEQVFNDFVPTFGGELVSELIAGTPDFFNADYIFRNDSVIAELKCLQKNFLSDIGYREKCNKLYERWVNEGLISPMPMGTYNSRDLPPRCQNDILKILKKPLKSVVAKANKQIKESKSHFDMPDAKGVLLLANDGNYALESDAVLYLVTSLIRVLYGSINYVCYFTVNMPAKLRTLDGNVNVWAMAHGEKETNVSYDFISKLGDGWIEHLSTATGVKYKVIDAPKELTEHIRFIR